MFTALGAPNVQAQTPLTTRELRRIIGNPNGLRGIRYNQAVGLTFQKFVLAHMPGPKMSFANTKPYPSPVRTASTRNRLRSVIPDGVAGASIGSNSPLGATVTTYPESTFIEVKAVKGKITRSYGQYQIEGMLDVLSRSQAASSMGSSRAYPSLYFVITGDTSIAPDVTQEATRLKILVWLSYVTVFPDDRLQVAAPTCLNCAHIFIGPGTPGVVIPGLTFRLGAPGISVPVLFDPPILDDGLIGHPGLPGLTAPNP
ncbi:MAG: hypothetical protein IPM54_29950 [Polyangiaceae bacterium]|nr:hypothetical protein [Polyangiaceae bacterium]